MVSERYSKLSPMSLEQRIALSNLACLFFSPINPNLDKILQVLGKTKNPKATTSLTINDFITWIEKENHFDEPQRWRMQIVKFILEMERADLLSYAGSSGFSMGGERCYYFCKEFSKKRRSGNLWLSEILGFNYIYHYCRPSICHITGISKTGDVVAGTGILIGEGNVITCAHVISDLLKIDDTLEFPSGKQKILETRTHSTIDIGVIKIDQTITIPSDILWEDSTLLDKIMIMGFPKIPRSIHPALVAQTGEICTEVVDFQSNHFKLFTAEARPGNSGGPIFSNSGSVVGIVSQQFKYDQGEDLPFYAMVPTSEVKKAVKDLFPHLSLPEDDYQ